MCVGQGALATVWAAAAGCRACRIQAILRGQRPRIFALANVQDTSSLGVNLAVRFAYLSAERRTELVLPGLLLYTARIASTFETRAA